LSKTLGRGRPGLNNKDLNQAISLWKEHGKSIGKAALSAGMSYATFYNRLNRAFDVLGENDNDEFDIKPPFDPEEPVEKTVERMLENYKNNKRAKDERDLMPIKVNHDKPICIVFMGDPHIGNPGMNIESFMDDVQIIRNTDGMKVINLGDTTDAWIGYLCKLYANSPVTVNQTWRLVEYFLGKENGLGDQFLVAIAGNHDLFHESYGDILEWMKEPKTIYEEWAASLDIQFTNNVSCKIHAAHDHPGRSQYAANFGQTKAAMFMSKYDIIAGGHTHTWMTSTFEQPGHDRVCHTIRARGYKHFDHYGKKLGYEEMQYGQSICCVIDPRAESRIDFITTFPSVKTAADFLNYKRSKL
jgi:predicted phosphodiesterase